MTNWFWICLVIFLEMFVIESPIPTFMNYLSVSLNVPCIILYFYQFFHLLFINQCIVC